MSGLAGRIAARLDALEAGAQGASNPPWTALTMYPTRSEVTNETDIDGGVIVRTPRKDDADAAHIAAWDPAAVLRLVDGLRAVVDEHVPFECCNVRCPTGLHCGRCAPSDLDAGIDFLHWPCPTLLGVAAALGVEVAP